MKTFVWKCDTGQIFGIRQAVVVIRAETLEEAREKARKDKDKGVMLMMIDTILSIYPIEIDEDIGIIIVEDTYDYN